MEESPTGIAVATFGEGIYGSWGLGFGMVGLKALKV